MKLAETVTFGGSALDRAAQLRKDPAQQEMLLADPRAGVLPIWRGKPLISEGDTPHGGWLPPSHPSLAAAAEAPMFLGLDEGAPRYVVDISAWNPPQIPDEIGAFADLTEQRHPLIEAAHFAELRNVMTTLSPREAELLATAKALIGWHQSHRFCASCGQGSTPVMAGWQRDCKSCGAHHFPRTDPVVIMLITRGNSVLLGRNAAWPPGMFSLLAGFVEPGETIEAAVRREVFEETGVQVGEVSYLASQPWPFPASLMLGCRGTALSEEITVDPEEIESARWMRREEVAEALRGAHPEMRPPRPGAIAGFLLRNWVEDRLS